MAASSSGDKDSARASTGAPAPSARPAPVLKKKRRDRFICRSSESDIEAPGQHGAAYFFTSTAEPSVFDVKSNLMSMPLPVPLNSPLTVIFCVAAKDEPSMHVSSSRVSASLLPAFNSMD